MDGRTCVADVVSGTQPRARDHFTRSTKRAESPVILAERECYICATAPKVPGRVSPRETRTSAPGRVGRAQPLQLPPRVRSQKPSHQCHGYDIALRVEIPVYVKLQRRDCASSTFATTPCNHDIHMNDRDLARLAVTGSAVRI